MGLKKGRIQPYEYVELQEIIVNKKTDTNVEDHPSKQELEPAWEELMALGHSALQTQTNRLRALAKFGVPDSMRSRVWPYLSKVSGVDAKGLYSQYLQESSPWEKSIRLDIGRTFATHEFFRDPEGKGQTGLFNVLKAYSVHDSELGYSQGTGFIAGVLLLHLPEEQAFLVFLSLMQRYNLRELYKPNMEKLKECNLEFNIFVKKNIPDLHRDFKKKGIITSSFATQWFLCLFTSSLPLPLAAQIIDLVLVDGFKIIFRLSLAILMSCKTKLIQMNMEDSIPYLREGLSFRTSKDMNQLITKAYTSLYQNRYTRQCCLCYLMKEFHSGLSTFLDKVLQIYDSEIEN